MSPSFQVKSLGGNRYEITLRLPDSLGLLSLITGLFASSGISIQKGRVATRQDFAEDTFEVQAQGKVDWKNFETDVFTLAKKLKGRQGDEVRSEINARIIEYLRAHPAKADEMLAPINLELDQNTSPTATVVEIRAEDTPCFLYELTNALSLLGINVSQMEVGTDGNQVHDRLWLTTESKEKITEERKLKALQWAVLLVKQFTHKLPTVPDPKAALERITLLGKEVFDREDFSQVLLMLKDPEIMTHVGRVFGTSRYLWEAFIRDQHESIFPILAGHEAIKVRKSRLQMTRELESRVRDARDYAARVERLNEYKDREIFRIDLRHILGKASYLGEFAEEFSDLAEAVVDVARWMVWEEIGKRFPAPRVSDTVQSEIAIFGLGKFGGRELGYASDLELMMIYTDHADPSSKQSHGNHAFYTEFVREFRKAIHARAEGVFELDLRLRPHGKDGPLAVPEQLFMNYYSEQGTAWGFERQALIRLRFVSGAEGLGKRIEAQREKFVFSSHPLDFEEVRRLRKKQREELVKPGQLNAKFSAGGLLDVEYLIQILQIAYGRRLEGDVRHPNSLRALRGLWLAGVIHEREFQSLRAAYIFLRSVINALRIVRGNAKDLTLPEVKSPEFTVLARRIGYQGTDEDVRLKFQAACGKFMKVAGRMFEDTLQRLSGRDWQDVPAEVSAPHADILRVSLDALLRGDLDGAALQTMKQIGFREVREAAARMSRLCPRPLAFEPFALAMDQAWNCWPKVADPDLALTNLEYFIARHPAPDTFWESLAESRRGISILLHLFGSSKYLSQVLIENPDYWPWLQEEKNLTLEKTEIFLESLAAEPDVTAEKLRKWRHRETLRIALAETLKKEPLPEVLRTFSHLADVVLRQALKLAGLERDLCVIALGKLGGRELNFSSDVDLLFLCRDGAAVSELAPRIQKLLQILKEGGPTEFLYRVDLRLRPHGDHGALALSVSDAIDYYLNKADVWEYQVLLKCRPAAGDIELANPFWQALRPYVYREKWEESGLARIREIKRKFEAETRQKGNAERNIKMGPGGIRDIEFAVQILQLLHGHRHESLQEAGTWRALAALEKENLLDAASAQTLREGYELLRRTENRIQLFENRQIFSLPEQERDLRRLARSLGFPDRGEESAESQLEVKMTSLREACRVIFDRLFNSSGI